MSPLLRGLFWRLRDAERRLANRVRRDRGGLLARMTSSQLFALTPDALRRGLAVGMFWAMAPIPFQMAPAALFCWLAAANLPVALVCVWISNPLTYAPIFFVQYQVGKWLLDGHGALGRPDDVFDLMEVGGPVIAFVLVGALASGIVASLAGYAAGGPLARGIANLRLRRITLLKKRRALRAEKRMQLASDSHSHPPHSHPPHSHPPLSNSNPPRSRFPK